VGDRLRRQGQGSDVHARCVGPQTRHPAARDDRVGKREGPPHERGVAGFGLVKELADDETAGVSRPQLAESGLVGDALARAKIGDRGRASEALTQPLRREERSADRHRSRP
jgi:hypothetical protein